MNNREPHENNFTVSETLVRHVRHKARIAYFLVWISSTIAMFIAVAFMLLLTGVNPGDIYFYIPVAAFAVIMAIALPLTAKIAKHYSV